MTEQFSGETFAKIVPEGLKIGGINASISFLSPKALIGSCAASYESCPYSVRVGRMHSE